MISALYFLSVIMIAVSANRIHIERSPYKWSPYRWSPFRQSLHMEPGTESALPVVQPGYLGTAPATSHHQHFAIKHFERKKDTKEQAPGTEYQVKGVSDDSELNSKNELYWEDPEMNLKDFGDSRDLDVSEEANKSEETHKIEEAKKVTDIKEAEDIEETIEVEYSLDPAQENYKEEWHGTRLSIRKQHITR